MNEHGSNDPKPEAGEAGASGSTPAEENAEATGPSILRVLAVLIGLGCWLVQVPLILSSYAPLSADDMQLLIPLVPALAWAVSLVASRPRGERALEMVYVLAILPAAWILHIFLLGMAGSLGQENQVAALFLAPLLAAAWVLLNTWRFKRAPASAKPQRRTPWRKALSRLAGLMELLLVIMVIGVFAESLFTRESYSIRSRISELILAASSAKTALSEGMQAYGTWSANWMSAITIGAGGLVAGATVGPTGVITISGTAATSFSVITMTPNITADSKLVWTCVGTPARYMPASCRN